MVPLVPQNRAKHRAADRKTPSEANIMTPSHWVHVLF